MMINKDLSLAIHSFEEKTDAKDEKKKHVYYSILVEYKPKNLKYFVEKRYSDFKDLFDLAKDGPRNQVLNNYTFPSKFLEQDPELRRPRLNLLLELLLEDGEHELLKCVQQFAELREQLSRLQVENNSSRANEILPASNYATTPSSASSMKLGGGAGENTENKNNTISSRSGSELKNSSSSGDASLDGSNSFEGKSSVNNSNNVGISNSATTSSKNINNSNYSGSSDDNIDNSNSVSIGSRSINDSNRNVNANRNRINSINDNGNINSISSISSISSNSSKLAIVDTTPVLASLPDKSGSSSSSSSGISSNSISKTSNNSDEISPRSQINNGSIGKTPSTSNASSSGSIASQSSESLSPLTPSGSSAIRQAMISAQTKSTRKTEEKAMEPSESVRVKQQMPAMFIKAVILCLVFYVGGIYCDLIAIENTTKSRMFLTLISLIALITFIQAIQLKKNISSEKDK